MTFTREQKYSFVSHMERAAGISKKRIALDDPKTKYHKEIHAVLHGYGEEIMRLHALKEQMMHDINETCWQTKAKREQAMRDAALDKERAEMRHKVEQRAAASYANAEGRARKPNKWGKKQPETYDHTKETITRWLEKFTEELGLWYDKVHWLSQLLDCMPETTKDYLMAQRRKLSDEWAKAQPSQTNPGAKCDSAGNILAADLTYETAGLILTKYYPESNQRGDLSRTFESVSLKTSDRVTDFVTALELATTNLERTVGTKIEDWRYCQRLIDGISNPDKNGTPWSLEQEIKVASIDGRQCDEWTKAEILQQLNILGKVHHDAKYKTKREEHANVAWRGDCHMQMGPLIGI